MKTPCCDYEIDAHANIESPQPSTPSPGDFAICLNCGAWLRYTDDSMRLFEADDLLDLPDTQLSDLRVATQAIQERGRMR